MASAETGEIRTAANRRIYAKVMRYTMMLGKVPMFIMGDFDPTLKGDQELEDKRKKREWRDVMAEWRRGRRYPTRIVGTVPTKG